jgi:NAD(P)-dependent dehydrogenase (short-subunit alcohol dehydrogenase family)
VAQTFNFRGQSAFITGGARGIGKAIAIGFACAGAAVTIMSRSIEELRSTERLLVREGAAAQSVRGDVRLSADVLFAVQNAERKFGPISVLVNCAGVAAPFGPLWAVDPDVWWDSHATHVRGALLTMHAVLPSMLGARRGHIINVASLAGTRIIPNLSSYAVGKATLIKLTEHVAAEGKPFEVAAFAIEPGTIKTAMTQATVNSPEASQWVPWLVRRLQEDAGDHASRLSDCVRRCLQLASGEYDVLSGLYLAPDDDLVALARNRAP